MPDYSDIVATPARSRLEAEVADPVLLILVNAHFKIAAQLLRANKHVRSLQPGRVATVARGRREVTLVGPALGSPAAAMLLERCLAQGVKNFIVLGVAGSLRPEVKIGDYLVPTGALAEEGTSAHYRPEQFPPLPGDQARAAVEAALGDACLKFHREKVWTTDAIYRETRAKVQQYGEQGLAAVEMEMSALFTVARYHGAQLAGLLVISDELHTLDWKPGFGSPTFLNSLRLSCTLGLNAALKLADRA